MDPVDRPAANGAGAPEALDGDALATGASGAGTSGAGTIDPEQVATLMVEQLTDMLAGWERHALALAERGVDPRPLLAALAANLHTVADQLAGEQGTPA